jgi:hypothetical protein
MSVLEILANTGQDFDADTVSALVGKSPRGRQLSAIFAVARRRHKIVLVGVTLGHGGRPLRVWRGAK